MNYRKILNDYFLLQKLLRQTKKILDAIGLQDLLLLLDRDVRPDLFILDLPIQEKIAVLRFRNLLCCGLLIFVNPVEIFTGGLNFKISLNDNLYQSRAFSLVSGNWYVQNIQYSINKNLNKIFLKQILSIKKHYNIYRLFCYNPHESFISLMKDIGIYVYPSTEFFSFLDKEYDRDAINSVKKILGNNCWGLSPLAF